MAKWWWPACSELAWLELAPVRAVEAAQVAVCTRKTMMMTCMAKWWWPACSELAWLELAPVRAVEAAQVAVCTRKRKYLPTQC